MLSLDFDSARLPNPNLTPEHEEWRVQLRRFIDAEIMPYATDWDEAGKIPDETEDQCHSNLYTPFQLHQMISVGVLM